MSADPLSYAVVTPARNEAANLRRLADCLAAQTVRPRAWVVVDDHSTDETSALVCALARVYPWLALVPNLDAGRGGERLELGRRVGRDVLAFSAGVAALEKPPDIVVKLDADVSFRPDYFDRLLAEFARRPSLGIASGSCYELEGGSWREQRVTAFHVRGASRAYRWACFEEVSPLDVHIGWDGLDEARANARGWETETIPSLPFFHHRRLATRDGTRWRGWTVQGVAAHYMGYRVSYLLLRALHRARREPAALAMVAAYLRAALRGEPRSPDAAARAYVRDVQRLRHLPLRMREALGRR